MTDISKIRIETERMILRPPSAEDFEGYCTMMADAQTAKYIGGQMDRAQAWRSWCMMVGAWHVRGFAMFSMLLKESGEWIGRTGPWYPEGWPGTEVGWSIMPEHTGKGLALEASVASMDYAVDELGWTDICHMVDPENIGSAKLAKALGSTNRGPAQLPEPYTEHPADNWGQTSDQWRENRKKFI